MSAGFKFSDLLVLLPALDLVRRRCRHEALRVRLAKIVRRAHELRHFNLAHRLDLAELPQRVGGVHFPSHVDCARLGNSQAVAAKHYVQVTEEHFTAAAQNPRT
jgi:hypothetical protein